MNLPSITPAQIVTLLGSAIGVAVSFGAPITADQRYALLAFVGRIAAVLLGSDVKIRGNRAANADKIAHAQTRAPLATVKAEPKPKK